ncbi:hypothetical protein HMPREF1551_00745 [Capnocytophaga sp. oral taxon 863 str. F0517]|uniref:HipA N-terminal domain-containing protein n=1 Tax=Capnocytophaga sp. oral taxon 863 TaxID=1227265 RepID=UPI0003981579|nr:HipA N-terminal domain-containing protein [Capnocytophaga sp. oral taxon 863]ERI64077.1 hypothetical protein HMPREF1551_00745 [Capnocytophaga sp. oral taxon 863 str. F0517]
MDIAVANYVKTGEELSPLIMPLNDTLYFSNPRESLDTFKNLPPLLADTFPDAFGNKLILEWFSKQNLTQNLLNPVEKLAFFRQQVESLSFSIVAKVAYCLIIKLLK